MLWLAGQGHNVIGVIDGFGDGVFRGQLRTLLGEPCL